MYLLNSSMTILSLTLWFLSWESTARLTSGLHGTRFYSPRLLILIFLIPYPLPFLRVNITFLSFLFIFPLFVSISFSLCFSLPERKWESRIECSYLCRCWLGKDFWRLCLMCCEGEHPVSLHCKWEERDSPCSQQGGQELPSQRDGRRGWLHNRKNITRLSLFLYFFLSHFHILFYYLLYFLRPGWVSTTLAGLVLKI